MSVVQGLKEYMLRQAKLDRVIKWGIKWSMWPVHLVTSCCGVEVAHTSAPVFDAERWGVLPFNTMRQTNVVLVEGTITRKMAKVLKWVYEQMPEPKFVIAMGACAVRGGLFWNSYHVVQVDTVVPVDAYIPGCPPTPEAVIRAFFMVGNKILGKPGPEVKPVKVDLTPYLPQPKPAAKPAAPAKPAAAPVAPQTA
ncbi:MAG: NADH-quinone oxidoreductase subunit NuoB [Thermoproteus sp.]